jgi:hypothetical protein
MIVHEYFTYSEMRNADKVPLSKQMFSIFLTLCDVDGQGVRPYSTVDNKHEP